MKIFASALAMVSMAVIAPAMADEPDGLTLLPGFHATVVADGLGNSTRHMVFRDRNTLYVSTARPGKDAPDAGVIALHLDKNHKADNIQHFSSVDNGTGIVFHDGALYVASATTLYRFHFTGKQLLPSASPDIMVDGINGRSSVAFDGKDGLYIAVGSGGNLCVDPAAPKGAAPVGLQPCPDMDKRAGIWRFDAGKTGQKFPGDGEPFATGIRDINAMAWQPGRGLYTVVYGRDEAEKDWPNLVSVADSMNIADEMFHVEKGTNMGWPTTYWDRAKKVRLTALEYGGDAKTAVTDGKYAVPLVSFTAHVAPQDVTFYNGRQFPAEYRGGAFIAFHGAGGVDLDPNDVGYSVTFVPFVKGVAGTPKVFAEGFAGPDKAMRSGHNAMYRPSSVAAGPDGALYVLDSQKGRIWRIAYSGN